MAEYLYDVTLLEKEIQDLIATYPELAEDAELRADMVEGSTSALDVLSRIVSQVLDAKSMAAAIKARATQIAGRGGRYERKEEAMRKLAQRLMAAADLKKVVLPEATLGIGKGRDSVDITDVTSLPKWAMRIADPTPDKTAIKEALELGLIVRGAEMKTGADVLTMKVA